MIERSTRRDYLAAVAAIGALSGCSAAELTGDGSADGSDSPTNNAAPTGDGTATNGTATGGTDRTGTSTAGDSSSGGPPAFVRWAPSALRNTGASLTHLTVPEFRSAASSFTEENADRIASTTGLVYAGEFGLDRESVSEVFGIAAESAVLEGSFAAADVSAANVAEDRNLTRDAYRGYEVWTADLLGVAVDDGTLVVTDDGRDTVETLIDTAEGDGGRLAAEADYPGPIDTDDPPSMAVLTLSGDTTDVEDVQGRYRAWEFGDAETTLTETLRFPDAGTAADAEVRDALATVSEYDQYDETAVELDGRDARITGTVENGEFSVFGVTVETPEPTPDPPSARLRITNTHGDVANGAVSAVHLTVTKAAGSSDIDLETTELRFVGPGGTASLEHADTVTDASSTAVFETTAIRDGNESLPIIDDAADRAMLSIDLDQSGAPDLSPLPAGSSVAVRLTTGAGGTTEDQLLVPQTLAGEDSVAL